MVNSRTGWGSTPIALNLSTQYQVQKLRPACGGNTLSPETVVFGCFFCCCFFWGGGGLLFFVCFFFYMGHVKK